MKKVDVDVFCRWGPVPLGGDDVSMSTFCLLVNLGGSFATPCLIECGMTPLWPCFSAVFWRLPGIPLMNADWAAVVSVFVVEFWATICKLYIPLSFFDADRWAEYISWYFVSESMRMFFCAQYLKLFYCEKFCIVEDGCGEIRHRPLPMVSSRSWSRASMFRVTCIGLISVSYYCTLCSMN